MIKITTCYQPSILHEAVELVHAFVNDIPVEQLCVPGPYSIPQEEILRIRDVACEGLDREGEEIQFFFHSFPFEDAKGGRLSIARSMVYAWAEEIYSDADSMGEFLVDYWQKNRGSLRIKGVHLYGLTVVPDEEGHFHNLTKDVFKLPIAAMHQMQLVEAMSHYEYYLQRLMTLLRPVIEKLPVLLLPWVQKAAPLLQQWGRFFSDEKNFREFFLQRSAVDSELPCQMRLYLRCFWPHISYAFPSHSFQVLSIHLAMGQEPGLQELREEKLNIETSDCQILRQLASPDRMSMLVAMMDNPMAAMEVARKLDLHPSSVFRDISSMGNSHLLIQEIKGGKSTYRTNYALLQKLFDKILSMLEYAKESSNK